MRLAPFIGRAPRNRTARATEALARQSGALAPTGFAHLGDRFAASAVKARHTARAEKLAAAEAARVAARAKTPQGQWEAVQRARADNYRRNSQS